MKRLKPEKLSVTFRSGVTPINPIIPRKYTLTHSDITAKLFLTIGKKYAYDEIGLMRDEVLGRWRVNDGKYYFEVNLHVGNTKIGRPLVAFRYRIFKRELPLALEAIRYGDREFFKVHPEFDHIPIWVYFNSDYTFFNRIECYGVFSDYK